MTGLDEGALARLREMGGDELVAQLLEMYATTAPGRAADGLAALERGDLAAAERAFHSLKSSSANIGAAQARALCATLESHARAGDEAAMREVYPALAAELERVCALVGAGG